MKNIKKYKKIIVALILAIALSVGAYILINRSNSLNSDIVPVIENPPEEGDKGDVTGQTPTEQRNQGEKIITNDGRRKVTPIIVSAYQEGPEFSLSAYVQGIYEEGGTCTLNAINGSAKLTKQVKANINASTTDCAPFRIPVSEFTAKGAWQITISYSSGQALGVSTIEKIEIE